MIKTTQLDPLPRNIRRTQLKAAIKAGKQPYEAGLEDDRKAGREEGFREGVWMTVNKILTAAFGLTYD